MRIRTVYIFGTFSFPMGEAASARLRELALGFLDHVEQVKVICPFSNSDGRSWMSYNEQGKRIEYYSASASRYIGTSKVKRLKSRISQIRNLKHLLGVLEENLINDGSEVIYLYGRSYQYLNALLNRKDSNNLNVRTIIDIVEPPHFSDNLFSYVKHPFSIDSHLSFRPAVLKRIDLGVFISNKLKMEYEECFKKSILVPSVTSCSNIELKSEVDVEVIRFGYLGSLIQKDHPQLMFDFFNKLFKNQQEFRFYIIGRSSLFEEGRKWRSIFSKSPFGSSIFFIDNPNDQELKDSFDSLNVILLLRYPDETQLRTFPTRIVEILKAQKPVILNLFGDLGIYFTHGENCLAIEENGFLGIEEFRMLRNSNYRNRLAANGMLLLKDTFNATIQARRILEHI